MLLRRRRLVRLLIWPPLFLLLINGVFYLRQPQIVFYPFGELEASPAQWGMHYEEVALDTADGVRLHAWYLPHPSATKTLLFLHGNGGNISHRGESLAIFHRLGLNVLIIDYRGYGHSEGEPSEEGVYLDAQAAWRYLTQGRGIAAGNIVIFGRSLGGAVAVDLASRVRPAALILDSTFDSTAGMAAHLFPMLSRLVWLRYRFDSVGKIDKVGAPLLMLHSEQDTLIPYRLGQRLFEAAPEPKRFAALRGDHNDSFLVSQPYYERVLGEFIGAL